MLSGVHIIKYIMYKNEIKNEINIFNIKSNNIKNYYG
jgi:hypothetical protein